MGVLLLSCYRVICEVCETMVWRDRVWRVSVCLARDGGGMGGEESWARAMSRSRGSGLRVKR